jgi:hypothetical protein
VAIIDAYFATAGRVFEAPSVAYAPRLRREMPSGDLVARPLITDASDGLLSLPAGTFGTLTIGEDDAIARSDYAEVLWADAASRQVAFRSADPAIVGPDPPGIVPVMWPVGRDDLAFRCEGRVVEFWGAKAEVTITYNNESVIHQGYDFTRNNARPEVDVAIECGEIVGDPADSLRDGLGGRIAFRRGDESIEVRGIGLRHPAEATLVYLNDGRGLIRNQFRVRLHSQGYTAGFPAYPAADFAPPFPG